MLIEFGDAFDYSGADFCNWCAEVGFKHFEVINLGAAASAAYGFEHSRKKVLSFGVNVVTLANPIEEKQLCVIQLSFRFYGRPEHSAENDKKNLD